jgi:hypothetical protein
MFFCEQTFLRHSKKSHTPFNSLTANTLTCYVLDHRFPQYYGGPTFSTLAIFPNTDPIIDIIAYYQATYSLIALFLLPSPPPSTPIANIDKPDNLIWSDKMVKFHMCLCRNLVKHRISTPGSPVGLACRVMHRCGGA